ncbi:hypothetical protein A2U01_0047749, partial [Trifolium medium]|nr:hypothetical protein [Trifolium medium]
MPPEKVADEINRARIRIWESVRHCEVFQILHVDPGNDAICFVVFPLSSSPENCL